MIGPALSLALAASPITLEQVRELSRANTDALKSQLEAQRAGEQIRVARSQVLPQVRLEAGGTFQRSGPAGYYTTVPVTDPTTNEITCFEQSVVGVPTSDSAIYQVSLGVTQLLYDGGKWWKEIARAGAESEAAQGQLAEQRLSSELEGVRRFYELFRAQKSIEVLESTVKQSEEQVERSRALFEAGRVQKRDAIAAEVNLGNDRIAVIRRRQVLAGAQADLAIWIRRPGIEPLQAVEPRAFASASRTAPAEQKVVQVAKEQRPLLKALDLQVRSADLAIGVSSAGYLPRLSIFANAGRQAPAPQLFFGTLKNQNFVNGGLNFAWDLFSGFGTQAATQQARYAKSTAELNRSQAEREVEGDAHRSVAAMLAQLEVLDVSSQNRKLAGAGLSLAEDRFAAGAGSTLDVRDAQLKLTQAELTVLEGRIDIEITRAGVERVMGGQSRGAEP